MICSWSPLSHTIIMDCMYDPWRTGSLDISVVEKEEAGSGTRDDHNRNTYNMNNNDSKKESDSKNNNNNSNNNYNNNVNDLLKIGPVSRCAHHQDLIAESEFDSEELVEARKLILSTLMRWGGLH